MSETVALAAAYGMGSVVFARWFVWYVAKAWPGLSWRGSDTAFCVFFSIVWPVVTPLVAAHLWRLSHPAKPNTGLFARWHAADSKHNAPR